MRNFIQPGNSLAIAVPYATGVSAGQGVLVGALFGVAAVDGLQNAMIEAATAGVFDLTKEPALAPTRNTRRSASRPMPAGPPAPPALRPAWPALRSTSPMRLPPRAISARRAGPLRKC